MFRCRKLNKAVVNRPKCAQRNVAGLKKSNGPRVVVWNRNERCNSMRASYFSNTFFVASPNERNRSMPTENDINVFIIFLRLRAHFPQICIWKPQKHRTNSKNNYKECFFLFILELLLLFTFQPFRQRTSNINDDRLRNFGCAKHALKKLSTRSIKI